MTKKAANDFIASWTERHDRVIVFAGVFDPIHKGHISAAKMALEWGKRVIFLPEKVPTHKHGRTSYEHRKRMIELAIADNPKMEVWDTPFEHHTNRETLTYIQEKLPKNQPIALLYGADVAAHISSWPDNDKLAEFGVAEVVFAHRSLALLEEVPRIPDVRISTLKTKHMHITSTLIRQNFYELQTSLPNASVASYIKENNLYGVASA